MNQLRFGAFHAAHFGSHQTSQWQTYLYGPLAHAGDEHGNLGHNQPWPTEHGRGADSQPYQSAAFEYEQAEMNATIPENGVAMEENETEYQGLSKEAVEIFKFSEAFRKERELSEEMEEKMEEREDTLIVDEFYDGQEAPAHCLVLNDKATVGSEKIRIQKHMLNSIYLESCQADGQEEKIVLWPVLPLRL